MATFLPSEEGAACVNTLAICDIGMNLTKDDSLLSFSENNMFLSTLRQFLGVTIEMVALTAIEGSIPSSPYHSAEMRKGRGNLFCLFFIDKWFYFVITVFGNFW